MQAIKTPIQKHENLGFETAAIVVNGKISEISINVYDSEGNRLGEVELVRNEPKPRFYSHHWEGTTVAMKHEQLVEIAEFMRSITVEWSVDGDVKSVVTDGFDDLFESLALVPAGEDYERFCW